MAEFDEVPLEGEGFAIGDAAELEEVENHSDTITDLLHDLMPIPA